jgi:hypothetical protein
VVASVAILRRRQAHTYHAAMGRRSARLAAGLFRWITLFGLIGFLTLIGQIVPFQHQWKSFVTGLQLVSVSSSITLLLGVMPFLKESRSRLLAWCVVFLASLCGEKALLFVATCVEKRSNSKEC